MADPTADFFDSLRARADEPLLHEAEGVLRIDLVEGNRTDHWFVAMEKGHVAVSKRNGKADSTLRAEKKTFDRIVSGDLNAMAAVLRGEIDIGGDPTLLVLFQRVFPGPSKSRR
jgi:putative sterol carrier protein